MTTDAELLCNIECEQSLLGCLLIANDQYARLPALEEKHFYDPVHQRIFAKIAMLIERERTASPVTVKTFMMTDDGLNQLGGPAYLVRLAGAAVSAFATRDYAEIVIDLWKRRQVRLAMDDARARLGSDDSLAEVTADLEEAISAEHEGQSGRTDAISFLQVATQSVTQMNDAYQSEETGYGLSWGTLAMDQAFGTIKKGQFIVLGGRPSMGKTGRALATVTRLVSKGIPCLFASLEMSAEDIHQRMMSQVLRGRGITIPYSRMATGSMEPEEFKSVLMLSKETENWPLLTIPQQVRSLPMLRSSIMRSVRRAEARGAPLGVIVIDYLQLVGHPNTRLSMHERVSSVADTMQSIAKSTGVPVIGLAQLSRLVEQRENKRPMMSDLKESGRLEEAADTIVMVYRDEYYLERSIQGEQDEQERAKMLYALEGAKNRLELIVPKNKQGPIGRAYERFDVTCNHIEDVSTQIPMEGFA